jgi:hypothetical protein
MSQSDFSLFRNDPLNRIFHRLHLRSTGILGVIVRSAFLILLTWLPMALFALWEGVALGNAPRENFLCDVAAIGQFLIGIPLFLFAEYKIDGKLAGTARHLNHAGLVRSEDVASVKEAEHQIARARKWRTPDLCCLLLGYLFTACWILPELYNDIQTWHALGPAGNQSLTWAGAWDAFVCVPLLNYWWMRWVWKIALWCWYLYRVSRLELRLVASHPDQTGGLEFLSGAQTEFGIAIFAFGCGVVGASVAYKIIIEEAPLTVFAVWGPMAGFALFAPLCFLLPLFMFTAQLKKTKKEALFQFEVQAAESARAFQERWFKARRPKDDEILIGPYLTFLANLNTVYANVKKMRVVPFDLRSASELFASTGAPLVPIIFHIVHVQMPDWLEFLLTLVKH